MAGYTTESSLANISPLKSCMSLVTSLDNFVIKNATVYQKYEAHVWSTSHTAANIIEHLINSINLRELNTLTLDDVSSENRKLSGWIKLIYGL
jgi:hypothetical protein